MENVENKERNESAIVPVFNYFDPAQFDTMMRISKIYAQSEIAPDMYKISATNSEDRAVANCMIAIEMSQRMGVSALTIMQNMTPIQGKPTFASKFIIARVNGCGLFRRLKFRYVEKGNLGNVSYTIFEKKWTVDQRSNRGYYTTTPVAKNFDGTRMMDVECIAYTTSIDEPDTVLESEPVSIRMAIEEGWYTKNGSKWQTMPRTMLMYRAATFWVNKNAPELLMGAKSTEEQQDTIDIDYVEVENEVKRQVENKVVNVDTSDFGDKSSEVVVDTDTGEIIEQNNNNDNNPKAPF